MFDVSLSAKLRADFRDKRVKIVEYFNNLLLYLRNLMSYEKNKPIIFGSVELV